MKVSYLVITHQSCVFQSSNQKWIHERPAFDEGEFIDLIKHLRKWCTPELRTSTQVNPVLKDSDLSKFPVLHL